MTPSVGAPSRLSIGLCLIATWLIWGSTYLAIKFALVDFPPFFQMGTRFIVAGLLMTAWLKWTNTPWPSPAQWRNAAIVGVLMIACGMGSTAYAEQTIASSLAVIFIACMPMMIGIFGFPFGVRHHPIELAGVAIGFLGVVLLMRGQGFSASPTGLAAMTVSVIAWSLGSVLSRHRLPLAPGPMGYASEMLCGGVALLLISAAAGEHPNLPPSPAAFGSWLYLIAFGSLIAFNAYMFLLQNVRASVASSYTLVCPVVGVALGAWLGAERLAPGELAATGVILAGVAVLLWGSASKVSEPQRREERR